MKDADNFFRGGIGSQHTV